MLDFKEKVDSRNPNFVQGNKIAVTCFQVTWKTFGWTIAYLLIFSYNEKSRSENWKLFLAFVKPEKGQVPREVIRFSLGSSI